MDLFSIMLFWEEGSGQEKEREVTDTLDIPNKKEGLTNAWQNTNEKIY